MLDENRRDALKALRFIVEGHELASADHARAISKALSAVKLAPKDGLTLYLAATVFSLSSAAVAKDDRLRALDRDNRSGQYAAQAVEFLNQAAGTGFFSSPAERDLLASDDRLMVLRRRAEFTRLLAAIKTP